ncbi:hypothetical protein JB92DRAFT_3111438 [Gautieria morchelliformis]|nr:hypothetical protein JB92DRAFT_3111438 [Gautieria morchelliformis]
MASQQSMDIQVISDSLANNYVGTATLALLAYDTLLTLPSEITYIWHRRVRLGSVLYLLARYPAFLVFIMVLYTDMANIPLEYWQYNTLGLAWRSREIQMLPRKSLAQTLAEQGLIRYGFVLTITLASGIMIKVLRPSIGAILSTVQDSLSTIIICRCHLALQEVAHPNGTTHSAHHPVMSFTAAARQIHNSLMEEFGDPSASETGISESREQDNASSTAVVGIELEEIPCGRELGRAVDVSYDETMPLVVVASTGKVSIEV